MKTTTTRVPLATWERETGVRFCRSHTGKMKGMYSLSTYKGKNKFCEAYSKTDDEEIICVHCYVDDLEKLYGKAFVDKYVQNTEILNSEILDLKLSLDRIQKQYFRFEAFGDIQSITQTINYFNICYSNPNKNFTVWTKNPFIIEWTINERGYKKPKNLKIGFSNKRINDIEHEEYLLKKYDFIDFVFTVFTEDYIKEHNIDINCGAKNCMGCLTCYDPNNKTRYIHEKLK